MDSHTLGVTFEKCTAPLQTTPNSRRLCSLVLLFCTQLYHILYTGIISYTYYIVIILLVSLLFTLCRAVDLFYSLHMLI